MFLLKVAVPAKGNILINIMPHMLNKFSGKAVFIHVPPVRYVDDDFIRKMKFGFRIYLSG